MKSIKDIPIIRSFKPPTVFMIDTQKYACPGWVKIADDVTYEEIRANWIQVLPQQDNAPKIKDTEYPVLSSKGDHEYIVSVKNNEFNCTCPGFGYRRYCKHVEMIKNKLKTS